MSLQMQDITIMESVLDEMESILDEFLQQEEKDRPMSDKTVRNFQVDYERFETYEEAVAEAQKDAMRKQRDVTIWVAKSVVKYPVPNYPVEDVVAT